MNREEVGLRTRDACDRIRAAGYPMLAHVAWSWWLNCADPTYTNNILDLERDAERLAPRCEPPIQRHPKGAHGRPKAALRACMAVDPTTDEAARRQGQASALLAVKERVEAMLYAVFDSHP